MKVNFAGREKLIDISRRLSDYDGHNFLARACALSPIICILYPVGVLYSLIPPHLLWCGWRAALAAARDLKSAVHRRACAVYILIIR